MATGVAEGFRVAAHVGIGIGSRQVAYHAIRREEDAHRRVIVARVVIEQPGLAIQSLPGIVLRGRHAAPAVPDTAIRRVELRRLHAGVAFQDQRDATQAIGNQVRERIAHSHRYPTSACSIILGGDGRAVVQARFRQPIEGDSIGNAVRVVGALQDAATLVVLEEAIRCYGATGRAPATHPHSCTR